MLKRQDLLDKVKIVSLRRAAILAILIMLVSLVVLVFIKDIEMLLSILAGSIAIMIGLAFIRQKVTLDESNQLLETTISQMEKFNLAEEALRKSEDRYHSVVGQASDIIFLYDLETKNILEGNLAFQRLLGYSLEDIAELSIYDIVAHDRSSIDSNIEKIKEKKQCYIGRRYYRKKDGSLLEVEVYVNLISIKQKSILCSMARDVTERKQAEEALRKSEQEKTAILDGLKTVSVEYLDPQMQIIWLNNAVQKHLGLSEAGIKGKSCFKIIQGIESPCPGCTALKALQTAHPQEGELVTPDGKVWISHSNVIKDTDGNVTGVVHVAVNITERKMTEKALRDSESKLASIIEFLPDATFVIDSERKIIAWNHAIEEMTGVNKDDMLGKGDYEYALPFYGERRPILVDLALEPQYEIEKTYSDIKSIDNTLVGYSFTPKMRGTGAYLWGVASPMYDSQGKIVGAIESIRDITEQKRMEKALQESKDYLDKIINSIGDPLFVKDRGHRVILANDAACKLWGRPRDEILGKTAYELFPSKEIADTSWKKDEEVFTTGTEITNEETNTYADKTLTVLVKKTPYTDNTGNQFLVGITRDITDRKLAEDRIIASLQEKEILLKEIHHRVKNNLQIISALLNLQSSNLTDENIIKIFRDSQNRIKSMALIHENLYRSKDLGKVDFNEYIKQLVFNLSQSYGDISRKIDFKVNSENVYLNINTAIPCGMIINELVSNSLKYAFPDWRVGEICIDLSSYDGGYKLVISDNGIGIKGDLNIKESKTLGFRLIDTLVRQIDGKMSLDTTIGTRCEIHFKGLK
ncbi:MAG: PAS domain S-box protein [Methanotrichaceae archaeon]